MLVIDSKNNPLQLKELQDLLVREWGAFDIFKGSTDQMEVPFPLLAVDDDNLLGGIAFSVYKSPLEDKLALWINGLIVRPEYRSKGIGSYLIQAAEHKLKEQGSKVIFALTNIPELYTKLEWKIVNVSARGNILGKQL